MVEALMIVILLTFILGATVYSVRKTGDFFNPLTLILYLSVIRYWLPAFLYYVGRRSPHPYFALIPSDVWSSAFLLVTGGHAVLAAGCLFGMRKLRIEQATEPPPLKIPKNTVLVALAAMILGMTSLYYYFALNVGSQFLSNFMETGAFRGTFEGQRGTGKFLLIGSLTQYGAILLGGYALLIRRANVATALIPPTIAGSVFLLFGGRLNSIVPLAVVGLLAWREHRTQYHPRKLLVWGTVAHVSLFVFAYLVVVLRGGTGLTYLAGQMTGENLVSYWEYTIWNDIGHFHPVAMAIMKDPFSVDYSGWANLVNAFGVLGFLGIQTSSVGEQIAATMVDAQGWGFHASFAGAMYLYGDILGVVLGCFALGLFLAKAYGMGQSSLFRTRLIGALILVRCVLGVYIMEPAHFGAVLNDFLSIWMLLYIARF